MATETVITETLWLSSVRTGQFVYRSSDLSERWVVVGCKPTGAKKLQRTGTHRQFSETLLECKCSLAMSPPQYAEQSRLETDDEKRSYGSLPPIHESWPIYPGM